MAEPIERPLPSGANAPAFGSDVIAETLRALDIPYIALNPGASYRGLHDSPGQLSRQFGAADAALPARGERGRDRARLRQGDRPRDGGGGAFQCRADARHHGDLQRLVRPHAGARARRDRAGRRGQAPARGSTGSTPRAIRARWCAPYTKWDDQPASPAAAREALMRAMWIANTAPQGPVYVNLDAEMQEAKLAEPLPPVDAARFMPPVASAPDAQAVAKAAALLKGVRTAAGLLGAKNIVMLIGRVSRTEKAWNDRVALAESIGAQVITCLKTAASFPTDHPLHLGAPSVLTPDAEGLAALAKADVILSLDWVDLAGTLKAAKAPADEREGDQRLDRPPNPQRLEHGPPGPRAGRRACSRPIRSTPFRCLSTRSAIQVHSSSRGQRARIATLPDGPLTVEHLARALRDTVGDKPVSLTHLPALLERRVVAVPSSARLPRLRRRRRARRRAGRHGRRGARAAREPGASRSASAATAIS